MVFQEAIHSTTLILSLKPILILNYAMENGLRDQPLTIIFTIERVLMMVILYNILHLNGIEDGSTVQPLLP